MHLPEDDHKSGRNMWQEYYIYNILDTFIYISVQLLVSLPYVIAQCRVVDYLKSVTDISKDISTYTFIFRTVKMKVNVLIFFEGSTDIHNSTRCNIPEDWDSLSRYVAVCKSGDYLYPSMNKLYCIQSSTYKNTAMLCA